MSLWTKCGCNPDVKTGGTSTTGEGSTTERPPEVLDSAGWSDEPYKNTPTDDGWANPDWKGWKEAYPLDWNESWPIWYRERMGRRLLLPKEVKPFPEKDFCCNEKPSQSSTISTQKDEQGLWADDSADYPEKKLTDNFMKIYYKGKRVTKPPTYYAESGVLIRYCKALFLPFAALVTYSTVFDGLTSVENQDFDACNLQPCRYMRIFSSAHLSGTGREIMQVQNGISRPLAIQGFWSFEVYPCPKNPGNETRTFSKRIYGDIRACGATAVSKIDDLLATDYDLREVVDAENKKALTFSLVTKLCFWINKVALAAFILFPGMLAKTNNQWGMENLPDAICPGYNRTSMQAVCDKWKTKKGIINHLNVMSPSKMSLWGGIFAYAIFRAIHDVMLLSGVKEVYTLTVSYMSTTALGVASVGLFLWAMSSTGVFIAPVDDFHVKTCACFYKMPELETLGSVASPFALLFLFCLQVQLNGMATLYGDILSYQRYDIPHYLAKQSYLWTWTYMTSPKVAGTFAGEPRKMFSPKEWAHLFWMHRMMFYIRNIFFLFMAMTAAPFIMSGLELVCDIITNYDQLGMGSYGWIIPNVMRAGLVVPSLLAAGSTLLGFMDLQSTCFNPDVGESFADQINLVMPDFLFNKNCADNLKQPQNKWIEKFLCYSTAIIWGTFLAVSFLTVSWGLFPRKDIFLAQEAHTVDHHSLAENELTSACGFMLAAAHITQYIVFIAATWDDMESLRNISQDLGDPDTNPNVIRDPTKVAPSDATQEQTALLGDKP
mmetsp:Transcript_20997/g.39024  ORF Transcript_20997/g.39024 Transcript_20997/m.39024 type:complete len:774 (+) Transcript_20997:169-2490(+)